MSDGTPDRTKTVIACADNIPVLVVSFPPGVNAPPPGEKVMIEIGEPRPGQYANVALQPVKGKTAYIGPLSRAALTIMQTAGNQKSYARSEEHTSELQSPMRISYAGFCLTTKKNTKN